MVDARLFESAERRVMLEPPFGPIGLSSDEARRRLAEFGPNAVSEVPAPS